MATYNIVTDTIGQLQTGDILNCPYSGLQQEITLPKGTYKLECWGAASRKPSSTPGKGGYASGTLNLDSTTKFYLYVGGQPTTSTSIGSEYWCKGGWNGGGASRQTSSSGGDSGGGGGASDICLVASSVTEDTYHRFIRSEESYKSRLIVAGGAGGGYSSSYPSQRAGGYCPSVTTSTTAYIGGMTAAGSIHSTSCEVIGAFGYGSSATYNGDDHSGAGGGWYGGGSYGDSYAGGGSSFAWSTTYASYVPTGYSVPDSMKLTDLNLIYGNASMTEPTGTTATGHSGDGYIRITCTEVKGGGSGATEYIHNSVIKNSHIHEYYLDGSGHWTPPLPPAEMPGVGDLIHLIGGNLGETDVYRVMAIDGTYATVMYMGNDILSADVYSASGTFEESESAYILEEYFNMTDFSSAAIPKDCNQDVWRRDSSGYNVISCRQATHDDYYVSEVSDSQYSFYREGFRLLTLTELHDYLDNMGISFFDKDTALTTFFAQNNYIPQINPSTYFTPLMTIYNDTSYSSYWWAVYGDTGGLNKADNYGTATNFALKPVVDLDLSLVNWTPLTPSSHDITQDGSNLTVKNAPVTQSGSALTF